MKSYTCSIALESNALEWIAKGPPKTNGCLYQLGSTAEKNSNEHSYLA